MVRKQIFPDTIAYIFDELTPYITIVYLIIRKEAVFLLDSYCGSAYIEVIKNDLGGACQNKRWIVINTHYHWDHVWGNAAFDSQDIFAHDLCPQLIRDTWAEDLAANHQYFKGQKIMRLPANTFSQRHSFPKEGIVLIHTPGHTRDSISIYDTRHDALYTGDNLEHPIIQLTMADTAPYLRTLTTYLDLSPANLFASHTLRLTKSDIEDTIQYLRSLSRGEEIVYIDSICQETHLANKKVVEKKQSPQE